MTELEELREEVFRLRELVLDIFWLSHCGKDLIRAADEYKAVAKDQAGSQWRIDALEK